LSTILGLDKFILVGMFTGRVNSLAFAAAHPERLSHLVIIDAGPEMRRPGSKPHPRLRHPRCRRP